MSTSVPHVVKIVKDATADDERITIAFPVVDCARGAEVEVIAQQIERVHFNIVSQLGLTGASLLFQTEWITRLLLTQKKTW